jgi:hypothetical protein
VLWRDCGGDFEGSGGCRILHSLLVIRSFTSLLPWVYVRGVPRMARYRQSVATKSPQISLKFRSTGSTGRSARGQCASCLSKVYSSTGANHSTTC